jgi:curved DNA-binding protein CbpA
MELGIITVESGITWYDVLGVLPGAEARKIGRKYDSKAVLRRPELILDAPPDVLPAVTRARELLDTAREVLGDPESRSRGLTQLIHGTDGVARGHLPQLPWSRSHALRHPLARIRRL